MLATPTPIRLWAARAEERARVWLCGHCGAKIYCGRLTGKPPYRCLCGKASWRAVAYTPTAGRLL